MHLSQLYFFHILAVHHLAKLFISQIPFTVFNFPTYSDFFNRLDPSSTLQLCGRPRPDYVVFHDDTQMAKS